MYSLSLAGSNSISLESPAGQPSSRSTTGVSVKRNMQSDGSGEHGADGCADAAVSNAISFELPSDFVASGAGRVRLALLPASSLMVPLLKCRAVAFSYVRSPMSSPARTVYLNASVRAVLAPSSYMAFRAPPATVVLSAIDGTPAVLLTATSSSKVTATVMPEPTPYVPFALGDETDTTFGAMPSTLMSLWLASDPAVPGGAGRRQFNAWPEDLTT